MSVAASNIRSMRMLSRRGCCRQQYFCISSNSSNRITFACCMGRPFLNSPGVRLLSHMTSCRADAAEFATKKFRLQVTQPCQSDGGLLQVGHLSATRGTSSEAQRPKMLQAVECLAAAAAAGPPAHATWESHCQQARRIPVKAAHSEGAAFKVRLLQMLHKRALLCLPSALGM